MAIPINNHGYTYIHLLSNLMITIIILSSFPLMITFFKNVSTSSDDFHPYEWQIFLMELYHEFSKAERIQVVSNKISYINLNGELITIEKYGHVIRYRNNGTGHIVLLQNVKDASFKQVEGGVFVGITSLGNTFYEAVVRDPKGVVKINE